MIVKKSTLVGVYQIQ